MRITYIHQHFRTPAEGGGQRPYEFARRLAARGHEVTVVRGRPSSEPGPTPGFKTITVDSQYGNSLGVARRLLSFAGFAARSARAAAEVPADVVFASSTPLTVALPAIYAKYRQKAPMVFEVRDLWPEVPIALGYLKDPVSIALARQLESAAYKAASEIIALSPTMKRGVERVAPRRRVTLIPNTSNIDALRSPYAHKEQARRKLSIRAGRRVLVYAGSLGVTYDPGWLLDVAALGNTDVFILGEGTVLENLREKAKAIGLDPSRHVLGQVSRQDVVDYYAAADVVVSSLIDAESLKDNSLNKVFDAFAAARPILFNHTGWLADLAVSEGAGWVVNSKDPNEVDRLLESLTYEQLRASSEAAGRIGDEQFATEVLTDRFEEVLLRARREN